MYNSSVGRSYRFAKRQRCEEENVFPSSFVDIIGEVAEEKHVQIVTIKLGNTNLH